MAQIRQTTGFFMKFYKDKVNNDFYWIKIIAKNLNAIYTITKSCFFSLNKIYYNKHYIYTFFYHNGEINNNKNAAMITNDADNFFYLKNKNFGNNNFTKYSWRKFAKLQAFL